MEQGAHRVLAALVALSDDLPGAIEELRLGRMSVSAQHEVAAALIEAGDLLDEHADRQASMRNGHPGGPATSGDVDFSSWSERDE